MVVDGSGKRERLLGSLLSSASELWLYEQADGSGLGLNFGFMHYQEYRAIEKIFTGVYHGYPFELRELVGQNALLLVRPSSSCEWFIGWSSTRLIKSDF